MLENIFTNVFGRPKGKSGRQQDASSSDQSGSQMTGPFSTSAPQMPQPPSLPYPPSPYPNVAQNQGSSSYYPSLPFSQPPSMPMPYAGHGSSKYPTGTLVGKQASPLDSIPFEAKLTLNNSTTLVSLDQLFNEIKKAADVVDRVDAYLRSSESDYDFKVEQGLISQ